MALSTLFIGCKSDDDTNLPEVIEPMLEEVSDKIFRISQAELINTSGTYDITDNYNTKDDELLFSSSGSLAWKPRYEINYNASSMAGTLQESYGSTIYSNFTFNGSDTPNISGLNNTLQLNVVDENTMTGTYQPSSGITLNLTLTTKLVEDFATIPQNAINFEPVLTIEGNFLTTGSLDLLASQANNSIYYANTDELNNPNNMRNENIIKYNVDTGQTTERFFNLLDFVTKRMVIHNNRLLVFGGEYTNSYDLDLLEEPTSMDNVVPYSLSRFSADSSGDYAYITGGDLNHLTVDPPRLSNAVQKVDLNNNTYELIAELPEEKFHCGTAIVDDKLYTFGGSPIFGPLTYAEDGPTDDILITDLTTGNTETLNMPFRAVNTYAVANEHLIYVTGTEQVYDLTVDPPVFIETINKIGVFNTLTNTFTELQHNLDDPNQNLEVINGIAFLNDKLYVLSGSYETVGDPPRQQSQLVEAVLN